MRDGFGLATRNRRIGQQGTIPNLTEEDKRRRIRAIRLWITGFGPYAEGWRVDGDGESSKVSYLDYLLHVCIARLAWFGRHVAAGCG